jgi:Cupin-like domain
MPSKLSSSSSLSKSVVGKTTTAGPLLDLTVLKQRQRNAASSKGGRSSSSSSSNKNRYWLYWVGIVTVAAVSILLAQQQYDNGTNGRRVVVVSQAEQLGEMSEQAVMDLWKQNTARGAVTTVDRVPMAEMSVLRFHREYLLPRKPVVIVNAYASSPLTTTTTSGRIEYDANENTTSSPFTYRWSFAGIRKSYGHVPLKTLIPLRQGQNVKCTTSGLCQGPTMTLSQFFDETFLLPMSERQRRRQQRRNTGIAHDLYSDAYPHDIDLEATLPGMFDEYQKLSIVAKENLHLATRSGNLDRWPSLYLGPATTKTGLHVDKFGTSFTTAVFHGRKQFILFEAMDGNRNLCLDQNAKPAPGSNYGVGADVFTPNIALFHNCPKAKQSHPMFASLGPGDLLYVPGSTHHAARNMDDSIAIAQNFLTIADFHSVVESHKGMWIQSIRRLRNEPNMPLDMDIPDSLLAQLDLYRILQDTGYIEENYYVDNISTSKDDDDDRISFVSVPDSVRMATERVIQHLEKALAQDPTLATRVAFLASNSYAVLSLKTSGVWSCLDDVDEIRHEKFLSVSPPAVPIKEVDNDVFNRIRHVVATAQQKSTTLLDCQMALRRYVNALEENRQDALVALDTEAGLE